MRRVCRHWEAHCFLQARGRTSLELYTVTPSHCDPAYLPQLQTITCSRTLARGESVFAGVLLSLCLDDMPALNALD
jgi:hypothetical protein